MDEFQECIEEYQECLEVVQICIDDENSFNHSPCGSQVEDLGQRMQDTKVTLTNTDFLENILLTTPLTERLKNNINQSEPNHYYGNSKDKILIDNLNNKITLLENTSVLKGSGQINFCTNNSTNFSDVNQSNVTCNDISILSDKVPSSYHTQSSKYTDEKDGYETCIDESSLSEDLCANPANRNIITSLATINSITCKTEDHKVQKSTSPDVDCEVTPSNSPVHHIVFNTATDVSINSSISEPCLIFDKDNHLILDSKQDEELKSYDNQNSSMGTDEFFLVQYPTDEFSGTTSEVAKSRSEPTVLDTCGFSSSKPTRYRRCLQEYYNDYKDCLEVYQVYARCNKTGITEEMCDDDIFNEILLPFKSHSAPDILDSSFVTLTYDPGPDKTRRKSAFVPGYQCDING